MCSSLARTPLDKSITAEECFCYKGRKMHSAIFDRVRACESTSPAQLSRAVLIEDDKAIFDRLPLVWTRNRSISSMSDRNLPAGQP